MKKTWFIFQNGHVFVYEKTLPENIENHYLRSFFLGEFNDVYYYTAEIPAETILDHHDQFIPLRKAFDLYEKPLHGLLTKAYAIIHWDHTHQFCGACGKPTILHAEKFERSCENCQQTYYPRISPCVIVAITKGNTLLMARSPHFPQGAYGLIAGFVESGETIEDAVHREVKEEIAIEIKNLSYQYSQPWPFPDSLMLGFTAEYASGEIQIDNDEIEAAGWYTFDMLPGRPSSKASISQRLIDDFVKAQTSSR